MTDKVDAACDAAFEAEFGPDIAPVGIPVAFNGIYADTVRMLVHRGTRQGYVAAWQRLSAENEALRKDAERYRWLRECSMVRSDRMIHITKSNYSAGRFTGQTHPSGAELDLEIDAALTEQRGSPNEH